ncbi:response regulator [Nostoc sp. 106C]|uniref:hybrid sensor histidine kinase/response regulator n=1 Tax=Nostoc sp. 106C TaxID=1932667 RepID=UPI000A35F1FF|nr:response regulator [Nostoc sp. 106C]OUL34843.1 hybrid sensor histidine kinase/response regulator [Nostoc sp. 106C]
MTNISSNTEKSKNIQVLIVEDEYILAINLQESLESLGYTVVDIADSAIAAIEKATELQPNLILMDIRLRGEIDGIQAAEQIWNHLQIPIIYVTGHSDKSTVERATLTSPFGYILKPIREQELYVAIQTALNRYEREQFLSTVLRGMGDGVLVVDTELHVKYLNQVAEALTGWRLDEAKDKMLTEVFQLIDEQTQLPIENPIVLALQSQNAIYLDNRILLVAKNGAKTPVADSATALRDNNGAVAGAVMVFRDDTQRRLAEERNIAAERAKQLEIQMAELQRLNQLKEDFLTTTSYEMRTPLSNIKMAISMLENILDQQGILNSKRFSASGSVTQYLNILRDQCEQELNLVDDLLEMRIVDADIYPWELTSIHLQHWLPHVAESFQELAQAQQQILEINVTPDLPPIVSDLNLLTRIVSELLNNAYKYTPAGEQIMVNAQLADATKNPLDKDAQSEVPRVQIIISNSGVEIPTTEKSLIFEPFYRILKSKAKEKSTIFDPDYQKAQSNPQQDSGTGLGLALVRKLVEHLQGTIDVTSGQGWTTFILQIPLKLSA